MFRSPKLLLLIFVNIENSTIDIFCRVIDNFGDIGVCWRLAQSFPKSYRIRLWVDDLKSFNKIAPDIEPDLTEQRLKGVTIRHWQEAIDTWQAADLVIEAFGCDLPETYQKAMKGKTRCWLNLEYLSAEKWVEGFHLQPSIQSNGVPKYFFFPGFTEKTGGLLRLQETLKDRPDDFFKQLLSPAGSAYYQDKKPLLINLFCYPHAPIEALLKSLPVEQEIMIIVAKSVAPSLETLAKQLGSKAYIERVAFIVQSEYDRLLQLADINLIRGEDSFVQAHWAAKPMLWHIYPQEAAQHMIKLKAWLDTINAPVWLRQLNHLWNEIRPEQDELIRLLHTHAFNTPARAAWHDFQAALSEALKRFPDLSRQILNFYEECAKKS